MHVDLAAHAPHNRKYGAAFAESWTTRDGTTFVAVGAVFSGAERTTVSDLLRTGARTLVTGRDALAGAIPALDRVVLHHARERRDDRLAAAVALLAFDRDGTFVELAGAGRLDVAVVDGAGRATPLHAHAAALGTGIDAAPGAHEPVRRHLRRDDLVVAATVPLDPGWWPAGDRSAAALLARSVEPEKAAAVVSFG